jgi:hypothetical protein
MTRKSILRKLIFLPLMTSVFLLCAGSLINFHQYHIWHKPLLQEFVAYKRESDKAPGNLNLHNYSSNIPVHFFSPEADFSSVPEFRSTLDLVTSVCESITLIPDLLRPSQHGLRAPPLP